ncbi:guanylate kinase [Ignatzschineria ureiclastica]|uniref:Guanylate kinase n=1 Tax=Ignatzschineria ureiclastica TaxID=472582 RepID=A0A2U2AFA8_9GAMM|nr:guanylate kinase [Ignatzschineria ureiclastica]PWD81259.1 guanylate kinase [Ignatzschineria ureiclastica]GGZ97559.1 guanylate kinase [Ignatzschineria ureiclastica]
MKQTQQKAENIGHVYVISAPSGGGKTSLVEALMAQDKKITRAVTHTTRAPRKGEQDGYDYHFVTRNRFEEMIGQGAFLEYAQVFDNLYGTSLQEVEKHTATGQDVVLVIDWQGAEAVKRIMPEAELIFIVPPSITALEKRLSARKQDEPMVVAKRMEDAVNQIAHYERFDYLVVNDEFEVALHELQAIFAANRLRIHYQKSHNRALLHRLLVEKI